MLDIKLKLKPGHSTERDWMAPSPLRTLFWNLTYACNFSCGICFTDSGAAHPRELDTREALDLVRKFHEAGVQDVLISGGEPFRRKDILLILAEMGKFGITARIASNGSLLDRETLARLRRETLTKSFQISLDTLDPRAYALMHGAAPETLPLVLENLRLIQAAGFHTTVSSRLTEATLPGMIPLLDRAHQEGWPTVTVHCPVHTKRVRGALAPGQDALAALVPVFDHFCGLPQRWLVETYIPWAPYHPVMRRLEGKVRIVHRGCHAGRDRLTVHPTGFLSPCVCLDVPEAYVGDARTDDLDEVFAKAPLCEKMRHPARHGICNDCANVSRCGGGCRAQAFALTGRIDGPDQSCPVWKGAA